MSSNTNGTFLWVALVCDKLKDVPGWIVEKELPAFPPGLDDLYKRTIDQIYISEVAELCKSIPAIVSVVYRPLH